MSNTKEPTALAEFINKAQSKEYEIENSFYERGYNEAIENLMELATELLPKEREQIERAYQDGVNNENDCNTHEESVDLIDAKTYFNKTYTQNIKEANNLPTPPKEE